MKNLLIILALIPAVMVGCHRGSKKNPVSATVQAAKDPSLQNKPWESMKCSPDIPEMIKSLGAVQRQKVSIRFVGDTVTRTTTYYSSADCKKDDVWVFEESGNFEIQDKQASNERARGIDLIFRALTLTAKSDAGVTAAKTGKLCGKQNQIQVNKKVPVTKESKGCYEAKVPRNIEALYRIDQKTLLLAEGTERPADLKSAPEYQTK